MYRCCRATLLPLVILAAAVPAGRAQVIRTYVSPYWGYYWDPYGLHGAADLTRARAEALVLEQEAARRHEEVREKRLERRRKEIEHYQWEWQNRLENYNEQRTQVRKKLYDLMVIDPPATALLSGEALNALAKQLELRTEALAASSSSTPVRPEWLAHLNVASRTFAAGNLAVLKAAEIPWPTLLRHQEFDADRADVERLAARAKEIGPGGRVDAEAIAQLRRKLASIELAFGEAFQRHKRDPAWNFETQRSARGFFHRFDEAVTVLEREPANAAAYLATPKAATVAALILYMKDNGLRFAPATDEAGRHYAALHRAMAEECARIGLQPQ